MKTRKYKVISGLIAVGLVILVAIKTHDIEEKSYQVDAVSLNSVSKELDIKIISREPERTSLGEFTITAYCGCDKCCGKWSDGLTYTGTEATEGRTIAVDPDVIPLGSIVEINGVEYVAEDVGGAIKGDRIDLYFNSHEDALEWGVQYSDIFLIEFPQFRK